MFFDEYSLHNLSFENSGKFKPFVLFLQFIGHESHERTAMEGVVDAPGNKTEGDYQTFDPKSTSYVPGQEETLGWSRTDTGGLNKSEELSNLSNNTSTETHSGKI